VAKLPEIWDCTTCNTCAVRCPKGLKPVEVLIGLRNILIEGGVVQPTVAMPWKVSSGKVTPGKSPGPGAATGWRAGCKMAEPGQKVENLIFVCCTIAYDPKVQAIAKNLVKFLNKAGVIMVCRG
jgi:heterodisulfide reductase subunit C